MDRRFWQREAGGAGAAVLLGLLGLLLGLFVGGFLGGAINQAQEPPHCEDLGCMGMAGEAIAAVFIGAIFGAVVGAIGGALIGGNLGRSPKEQKPPEQEPTTEGVEVSGEHPFPK